jgi:hypothetical protein
LKLRESKIESPRTLLDVEFVEPASARITSCAPAFDTGGKVERQMLSECPFDKKLVAAQIVCRGIDSVERHAEPGGGLNSKPIEGSRHRGQVSQKPALWLGSV